MVTKFKYLDIKDLEIIEGLSRWGDNGYLELKESIVKHGLVNPLTVRIKPRFEFWYLFQRNKYQIVDGAQRYRACKELGIRYIPCAICHITNAGIIESLAIQGRFTEAEVFRLSLQYTENESSIWTQQK